MKNELTDEFSKIHALPAYLPKGVQLRQIVQVGIVVPDLENTILMLGNLFGMGPFRRITWPDRAEAKYYYRDREEHIKVNQAFAVFGTVEIELIQPIEGNKNAYREFLEEKGGGIHHVLFEVSDLELVIGELAKAGVTVLQSGTGIRPGTRWALLDTQALVGFFVELRHRRGESDGTSLS